MRLRTLCALVALLLLGRPADAQYTVAANTTFTLSYSHDCLNVTGFQLIKDGSVSQDVTPTATCGTGAGTFTVTGGLAAGQYTLNVTAYNATGTTAGTPISLTVGLSCTYSLTPTSQTVLAAGEAGKTVAVGVSSGSCPWVASSNTSWLAITAGASGTGAGTVTYTAAANTGLARGGSLTIAALTFPVTQGAPAPTTDVTPPIVAITAPANGTTVSRTVAIRATATDNLGVTNVVFTLDGKVITPNRRDFGATSPTYATSYNFRKTPAGNHTLSAIAYDGAGNTATSTITVIK